ncbi:M50 family peptidase [Nonomuraea mesophila]|uniref:M50 family peptidase n=1 Tax=Nonomuraea mesophila TaxID=2530382 RepID=A0A4R5FXV6_9ACTN|nr:M50 family metallopeptidase [Nonomuraea mesophila]TDE60383.1 M50 family peptidase [Nonomuraea mesophila]
MNAEDVLDGRTVELHDLSCRRERDEWVVGRIDTGRFIAVPEDGKRVIDLLGEKLTTTAVHDRLLAETGRDVDVDAFVEALTRYGFVRAGDEAAPVPPSWLPRLTSRHVRWLMARWLWVVVGVWNLGGLVLLVSHADRMPMPSDLLAVERGSVILLAQLGTIWASIFVHELAHLLTARACDVPGRMRLGTRLQFLVVETDVSGIWHAGRRERLAVYLSGIAVNVTLATVGLIAVLFGAPPLAFLGTVVFLAQVMLIVPQFFAFMRTDVYFVVQDLFGCRNLFGDATAFLAYLWARLRRGPAADPSGALPRRERYVVRAYSVFVAIGSVVCVGVSLTITLPVAVPLVARSVGTLLSGGSGAAMVDAAVVLGAIVIGQVLWATAFWKRKRSGIMNWLRLRKERAS